MDLESHIKEHLEHMLLRWESLILTKLRAGSDEIDELDGMARVLKHEHRELQRGLSSWIDKLEENKI